MLAPFLRAFTECRRMLPLARAEGRLGRRRMNGHGRSGWRSNVATAPIVALAATVLVMSEMLAIGSGTPEPTLFRDREPRHAARRERVGSDDDGRAGGPRPRDQPCFRSGIA